MKRIIINLFLIAGLLNTFSPMAHSEDAWVNDLKSLFTSNNAIIYEVNIRTFNATENNNNGIIEEELGEQRGNFINAIDRLNELEACGINTINLLPVTPVGKIKALGTAGSLYAASSFNELNPQLKTPNSKLSLEEEMRLFVQECHKRRIRVIVDLPCCGAYDLYLKKPDLFLKDKNQNPIIPADWTDVRLLDADNMDVYALYQGFVDLMISLDVDGIKANVATLKPYSFWKKLIDEAKTRNPQFLFLADASTVQPSLGEYTNLTPLNKILEAGFDGYYGNYSDFKNWITSKDLISHVIYDVSLNKKHLGTKSVIGDFSTHDEISPMLVNGPQYSKMIVWLNSTLPLNAYYTDGFQTGEDYLYPWANKKAAKTFTDDDYYFVHRGKLDIFNFSAKPEGKKYDILNEFIRANKFKGMTSDILTKGNFVPLKTSCSSVFAYARSYDNKSLIVFGNMDFKKTQNIVVSVPKLNNELMSVPIKISNIPEISKGKIKSTLAPGEIQILFFDSLTLK